MAFNYDFGNNYESDGSDEENVNPWRRIEEGSDYVLFVIDTHPSMFIDQDGKEDSFTLALKACYDIADSTILASVPTNRFAVAFANNDPAKMDVVEFRSTLPDVVNLLEKIATSNTLKAEYERLQPLNFSSFLLECKKRLLHKPAERKGTIVYVTNDDNPVLNNEGEMLKSTQITNSFSYHNILLKVVTTNPQFDCALFYQEAQADVIPVENIVEMVDSLSLCIRQKIRYTRAKFYPVRGNFDKYIDVVYVKGTKSNVRWLANGRVTRDTFKEIVKIKETQEILPNNKKCVVSLKNGESIELTPEEKTKLFTSRVPLGYCFCYVSTPQKGWPRMRDHGSLVQSSLEGDSTLFDCFWQYCMEREHILMCLRKRSSLGPIGFVELTPKVVNGRRTFLETPLLSRNQYVIHPLAKEHVYRQPINEEQIKAMEDCVCKLTFNYHPTMFCDPVHERCGAYIKSCLLKKPIEEVSDFGDDASIDARIGDSITAINKAFPRSVKLATKKRVAASSQAKTNKKNKM